MQTTPIADPNAARLHRLTVASTRRELTPHEAHEARGLRRKLGRSQAKRRIEAAHKAALWGWA